LEEWKELNGMRYSDLPEQVRRGVDRRYLSSIILLQETAKDADEALRLKQLVFERINSGGIQLEPQEARNAIYNGPLNQLCIKLARNEYLCKTWNIPASTALEIETGHISDSLLSNERYRKMIDVELVLRFFAYRQRLQHPEGSLEDYLDLYLQHGNSYSDDILLTLANIFTETIRLVYDVFGDRAFFLWRPRQIPINKQPNNLSLGDEFEKNQKWGWYERPALTVYEPMMFVFSQNLNNKDKIVAKKVLIKEKIKEFYEKNYDSFGGRNTTNISKIAERNVLFEEFISYILSL
jgi:hypothetical protein